MSQFHVIGTENIKATEGDVTLANVSRLSGEEMPSALPRQQPSNSFTTNIMGPQAFTGAMGVNISGNPNVNIAHDITNFYTTETNVFKDLLAEKLSPIFGAAYDSLQCEEAKGCTPGTRVDLLKEIDDWVAATDNAAIYWLSGLAGTGKSTIAHSVAHKYNNVGASFFFSRDYQDRSEVKNVVKTLAYQLGIKFPALKQSILKEIGTNMSIINSSMQIQLQKLLLDPIMHNKNNLTTNKMVIVLDALDECNYDMKTHIIKVLAQVITQYDFPLKFFITSRPEVELETIFKAKIVENLTNPFILHNIEKEKVNNDIRLYLEKEFMEIPIQKPWPDPKEMESLIKICSPLFIAASTAVKFISSSRGLGPQKKLNFVLENKYIKSSKSSSYNSLDEMYQKILNLLAGSEYWNEEIFKTIVAFVILSLNNLSFQGILQLLGHCDSEDEIYEMLLDLKAVLLVSGPDSDAPVHAFHLSFHDFLTNPERCKDKRFYISPKRHHADITKCCLAILTGTLTMNIGNVDDFSIPTEDIPKENITEYAQYAATYWLFHLAEVDLKQNIEIIQLVTHFIFKYLLQWLEVVSICGQLSRALEGIKLCNKIHMNELPNNCKKLFNDIERFMLQNFDIIMKHALQIYKTALLCTPQETLLYQMYKHLLKDARLLQGYSKYWNPCLQVLEGHSGLVTSVVISQDGSTIVSGSFDKTVNVWNSQTGELVQELHGHSDFVTSVAISCDGSTIVSGSYDKTVKVWNSQTGELCCELQGHSESVSSVAILHDGSTSVSGSDDMTVRVWHSQTGELIHELRGHSDLVTSVAISQDGSTIISGSWDKTVRVWNSQTGEHVRELQGHSESVSSVAISHDGSNIVSGSDDMTVRVWHSQTGELVHELRGHSGLVTSVAISHDGSTIVSGSFDETVRVWSTITGKCIHVWTVQAVVLSVGFHENDTLIIANNKYVLMLSTLTQNNPLPDTLHDQNAFVLIVDDWIVISGKKLLWIPPDFRPTKHKAAAVNGKNVVIGTRLGRVAIFLFSAEEEN